MDQKLLKTFWDIAEHNENKRTIAIPELLSILTEKQGESKKICEELNYTLKRLVKGLASTRKWARLGFTMALTQILRSFKIVKVSSVLKKIDEFLPVVKSDAKSEQSNSLLGHMMVYLSLIQSNRILKCKEEEMKTIVEDIQQIKKKKPPLHMICTQTLVEMITKVPEGDLADTLWSMLETPLSCGWEKCTPDTLWMLLIARKYMPAKVDKDFLTKHWKTKNLLNEKNYDSLEEILMKSTADHPIMHPVCTLLLQSITEKPDHYDAFWSRVIYEKLFNSGSNRTFLVFQLVPEALKLATTPQQVYTILSPPLVSILIKSLTKKQQVLHSAAKQLSQALIKICKENMAASLQVAMVTSLVTPPGTVIFDAIDAKNKCVQKMLAEFKVEAAKELSELLMKNLQGQVLLRPSSVTEIDIDKTKSSVLTSQQKWSISTLSNFISQSNQSLDVSWCNSILEFIFKTAFFQNASAKGNKAQVLDTVVHQSACQILFRTLDRLSKHLGKGMKGYQAYNDFMHHLVNKVQLLMGNKTLTLVKPLDEEVQVEWEKVVSVAGKIKKKREKNGTTGNDELAFELLFLHHGLQLFTQPEPAMEVLLELHTCYEKASKKLTKSSSSNQSDEPHWVDVVIDLLMSLLSQQSHLVRTVVITVFTMLCPHLTRNNLQLVLDVLKPNDGTEDSLLQFDSDAEGEDGEMEVEDESTAEESDQDDVDESESDDSSDDEKDEDVNKLRSSVKSALGSAAIVTDEEESDDDMDDDAMFRLDSALTAAFKSMVNSKKKNIEKETNLKHYKMRCLDLVEILIHHCTSSVLLLDLLPCLLSLMEAGVRDKSQKDLGDRANKVFYQLVNVKKWNMTDDFDNKELPDMVKNLMDESTKLLDIPMIQNMATACVFVIHIIHSTEKSTKSTKVNKEQNSKYNVSQNLDKVLHYMEEGLNDFCLKRESRLSHYFFLTLIEKEPVLFWPLAETILGHATSADVRIFCRTQATALLSTLITKTSIKELSPSRWEELADLIVTAISQIIEKGEKQVLKPRYLQELLVLLQKLVTVLTPELCQKLISVELLSMVQMMKTMVNMDSRKVINKIMGQQGHRLPTNGSKKKKNKKRKRTTSESQDTPNTPVQINGNKGPKLAQENIHKDQPTPKRKKVKSPQKSGVTPVKENHNDQLSSDAEDAPSSPKKKKVKTPKKSNSPNENITPENNKKRRKSDISSSPGSSPKKPQKKRKSSGENSCV